jgi:hypothetical protein
MNLNDQAQIEEQQQAAIDMLKRELEDLNLDLVDLQDNKSDIEAIIDDIELQISARGEDGEWFERASRALSANRNLLRQERDKIIKKRNAIRAAERQLIEGPKIKGSIPAAHHERIVSQGDARAARLVGKISVLNQQRKVYRDCVADHLPTLVADLDARAQEIEDAASRAEKGEA